MCLSLWSLLLTTITDPGIIPRQDANNIASPWQGSNKPPNRGTMTSDRSSGKLVRKEVKKFDEECVAIVHG